MQTMTPDQAAKIEQLINEFAKDPDIVEFVTRTEGKLATTRGHYGDYMAFLTPYASKPAALHIISRALVLAGADASGVSDAIMVLKGGQ